MEQALEGQKAEDAVHDERLDSLERGLEEVRAKVGEDASAAIIEKLDSLEVARLELVKLELEGDTAGPSCCCLCCALTSCSACAVGS